MERQIDAPAPFAARAMQAGKSAARFAAQLAVVVAVYGAGCALASVLPVRLPGNIVGMVLLLALLGTGLLKARHVGRACDCLLDNMSLFFIPAAVAILGCVSLLEGNVAKFALVCVATTVLVFLATSYTVVLASRLMARRAHAAEPAASCAAPSGAAALAAEQPSGPTTTGDGDER